MNAVVPPLDKIQTHYEQQIALLSANMSLSSYWHERSTTAWQKFLQLGFPTRRQEAWKYLDLNAFLKQEFSLSALPATAEDKAQAKQYALTDSYPIYCINGIYLFAEPSSLPTGVTVNNVFSKQSQPAELADKLLNNPLAQLNQATLAQGIAIDIADNITVDKPIHIIHVATEAAALKMLPIQNQWTIGKNSQVQILESYQGSADTRYCYNITTLIHLQPTAKLTHYLLQQEGNTAFHFNQQVVQQQQDSEYLNHVFSLGGGIIRNDKTVLLIANGAVAQLSGMYHAKGRDQIANHLYLQHDAVQNASTTQYKGLADGQGKGVFNGKIVVNPAAQKVSAQLQNKNLLLSPTAEIDTKPELEIYSEDVLQCTHGASVGQLDDNALFYLTARGIDKLSARQILTRAFIMDRLSDIKNEAVKQYIEQRMVDRL